MQHAQETLMSTPKREITHQILLTMVRVTLIEVLHMSLFLALSLHGDGEKGMDYKFSPNQDGTAAGDSDELAAMDYTPAKKNTPIHN
ncbi:hypothetical protein Pyn_25396 [Prunus yedoensis var. nudiflora]|uniref:Uncharacterized protein n=1 Tax=Prunus yedoensis var. nudiflora TaxID=2094558 RepID=A0A314XII2_PRUYE|nr:hypothetical protein Pyn_25396 [Prunus yedoensis var. nudiflora]